MFSRDVRLAGFRAGNIGSHEGAANIYRLADGTGQETRSALFGKGIRTLEPTFKLMFFFTNQLIFDHLFALTRVASWSSGRFLFKSVPQYNKWAHTCP